jgi:hypothetical protein
MNRKAKDASHAWKEHSSRYPDDDKLRQAGFTIARRSKGHEPVWTRDGVEYSQSLALSIVEREDG